MLAASYIFHVFEVVQPLILLGIIKISIVEAKKK